jgi:hypothetical protein
MSKKDNKFEVVKVNTIQEECSVWNSLITTTAWQNGEGFDVGITSKNGGIQNLSITYSEFYLLKKMVETLDRL